VAALPSGNTAAIKQTCLRTKAHLFRSTATKTDGSSGGLGSGDCIRSCSAKYGIGENSPDYVIKHEFKIFDDE
jgi:hypothetical protein